MKISRIFDKQAKPQHVVGFFDHGVPGERVEALDFAHAALLGEEWGYAGTKALGTLEEVCVEAHGLFESYRQEVGVSH
jgi:hypothetical protein